MNITLLGEARRFVYNGLAAASRTLRLSGYDSLAVANVEPELFELSRAGRRFIGGNQIIANGIAPVAAIPTVTATLALYNAESAGGKSLSIEQLGLWLGSGTPAAGLTLLATVSPRPIATAPTGMATGYGIASASGSTSASKALWATAVTLPGIPAWMQILSSFQLAAANVGQGDLIAKIHGALLVPPGHALGLAILSGAGTSPLYGISAMHSEIDAALE